MRHQRAADPTKLPAGGFIEPGAVEGTSSWEGEAPAEPRAASGSAGASPSPSVGNRGLNRNGRKITSAFGSLPLTPSLSPEYRGEGAVFRLGFTPSLSPEYRGEGTVFRPGFTLIETIVALVVLAATMLAVVQTVAVVSRQRQLTERRALAVQEVANVMERVYGLPWSELTQERAAEDTLSPVCRQRLPAATLQVTVQAAGDPPNEKRILVEIDWQGADGGRSRPVRLTAWRFRSQEARP